MSNLRQAAQQALEALTAHADLHGTMYLKMDAINALRAALAEDALQRLTDVQQDIEAALAEPNKCTHGVTDGNCKECYMAEPEQEPLEYWNAVEGWVKIDEVRQHFDSVGCGTIYKTSGDGRKPLYTSPPQRKPLTEEEINEIADEFIVNYRIPAGSHYDFARAIEHAHGIKGEA